MPLPEHLAAIRQEIYYHTEEYRQIIEKEPFKSTFDQHYFDPLKTTPKGFPKDWEHISLIRNRSFGFGRNLTEKELLSENFIEKSAQVFRLLLPVNHFFNRAIEESGSV